MTAKSVARLLFAAAVLGAGLARAQDVALPEPAEAPAKKTAGPEEVAIDEGGEHEIDLANIVTSAAKGVTTVQEAPSIVTIITGDEIKARGFKQLSEAYSTVPGWIESSGIGNQVPLPLVRGTGQAVLLLRDGVSMFEPWVNNTSMNRTLAMETIKRIEMVTGPGGVLWGANSFLGVLNIISKDAEDVPGHVEVSAGYGDGPGNKQNFRAYGMFGMTFLNKKIKLFQHISYDSYIGPVWNIPNLVVSSPSPNPTGPVAFGPLSNVDPPRSQVLTIDGKYSFGPVTLTYSVPIGDQYTQLSFNSGVRNNNMWTLTDQYAILEYKDRFWKDRFGLSAKGYFIHFNRHYFPELFPSSTAFPTFTDSVGMQQYGLFVDLRNAFIQRTGGTIDADLNLPYHIRLLFGGEAFYESVSGSTSVFPSPQDPANLPFYCPVNADGTLVPTCPRQTTTDMSREVVAGFVDAQWRPVDQLGLDAGVRLQKGLGERPYDLKPLYSAAAVWRFLPDYHLKATYSTGFRAPVFFNTDAVPAGLTWGANKNLKTEDSQSFQGELNARILRNVKDIRVLELRADYSYTVLDNLIQIISGFYKNSGKRAIHSVEAYARMYLQGDHFLTASYTFLDSWSSDSGYMKNVPHHTVSVGATFSVIKNFLDVNTNLNVLGAYKDANRYPNGPGPIPDTTTSQAATALTFDTLSPVALLQLGAHVHLARDRVTVNAQFYNVLNQRYYWPDYFYDITPSVETTPTPAPGFNFFGSVTYHP
jgi:outer membrane receptor protein involved in Fe transport